MAAGPHTRISQALHPSGKIRCSYDCISWHGSRRPSEDIARAFEASRFEVRDYVALLERADDGSWSAYVPDLPGCTSYGPSREEAARNVHEAVAGHIACLRKTGQSVPEPLSLAEIVHVA